MPCESARAGRFFRPRSTLGQPGARAPQAGRLRPLERRLSVISAALFGLITGFGLFTLHLFNGFNALSGDLRERWLPTTRVIGDLNNYTSDYRAAEGDYLLASGAGARQVHMASFADLARAVSHAEREYERIRQSPAESSLYAAFMHRWQAYQAVASRVVQRADAGDQAGAIALYRTSSRDAYTAASDVLGALTAFNVERARLASAATARAYDTGRVLILLALLAAGAMLAASLAYIRGRVSGPLSGLAHAMRMLATNTTDIDVEGADRDDEIGDIARAVYVFRARAVELLQSQRGLAQQAAMLEQKLAYEQNLTRMQRNFVAMVSHEFRTPLTAIDAHAQRLINMKDRMIPDDMADRAGRIRSAVQRITNLMDNLLNSSRLMDGEPKLFFHPASLDLAVLLKEVCAFHREIAPNAAIEADMPPSPVMITGDRDLLFQTFSNLLGNAIKYSPGHVMVEVGLQDGPNGCTVSIRDHGLGIPAADLPGLFTRYYRGANVSEIVGTGVGLYLAKTVVELHGGEISVQSHEGVGSCFTVSLPSHSTHLDA